MVANICLLAPLKALLHGKASIAILVSCNTASWSLSVYTLNQVACFTQSLFTNCSRQNGESWQWRHYHTNWGDSPSVLWPNNITTFFSFPVMFYLPCADHVLLFVDDFVTSWPQTKISDWSEIKCIVILAVQNRTCSIPKCVLMQLLKVAWYRAIALFTLYFLVYDTSIMILALPCNRGFRQVSLYWS